jgi:hypothetical protein
MSEVQQVINKLSRLDEKHQRNLTRVTSQQFSLVNPYNIINSQHNNQSTMSRLTRSSIYKEDQ